MTDKQLPADTKIKLIKYVAALLKSEKKLPKKPFNDAFNKAMGRTGKRKGGKPSWMGGIGGWMGGIGMQKGGGWMGGNRNGFTTIDGGDGDDDIEGFTTTTAELITNQTQIMEKQIHNLNELMGATEQKIALIDKQQQTFQLANLVLTFVYYGVLVAVKGLMLMHYLTGSVVRDEWVDTIALTFLFVYPYIIYPIEYWLYSAVAWVVGLVYNTTQIPDMSTLVTGTNAYAPPVDLDSKFQPTA
jgi:hypothetical protein